MCECSVVLCPWQDLVVTAQGDWPTTLGKDGVSRRRSLAKLCRAAPGNCKMAPGGRRTPSFRANHSWSAGLVHRPVLANGESNSHDSSLLGLPAEHRYWVWAFRWLCNYLRPFFCQLNGWQGGDFLHDGGHVKTEQLPMMSSLLPRFKVVLNIPLKTIYGFVIRYFVAKSIILMFLRRKVCLEYFRKFILMPNWWRRRSVCGGIFLETARFRFS